MPKWAIHHGGALKHWNNAAGDHVQKSSGRESLFPLAPFSLHFSFFFSPFFPFFFFFLPFFPFPFFFSFSHSFSFWLVVILPFLWWVGPFTNVSLQQVLWWIALCVLSLKPALRFFVVNSPPPILQNISAHHARVGIRVLCESFFCPTMFFHRSLVSHKAFPNWSDESSLTLFHHAKTPQLRGSNLQFPEQPLFGGVVPCVLWFLGWLAEFVSPLDASFFFR